jgi:tetratricopeptide (TPR) repeat protein
VSKQPKPKDSTPDKPDTSVVSSRTSLAQAIVIILVTVGLFFGLLEGGLALFGVQPVLQEDDPFVGFALNVPLFIPSQGVMTTAPNKKDFFNQQHFSKEKPPNTYRIFCLGGSTTYGRPYNDKTSFPGWLRELLPVAERSKNWEVINAGGISYASYRVAQLMEELIDYQPDLFIIYTGHNEFLEERTYSQIKEIPSMVRSSVSLLAKTRTWSAMKSVLQGVGLSPQSTQRKRTRLAGEVDAILDKSAGLNRYRRDDPLKKNILQHYQLSLERMVALARSVNARVTFVSPASNLKDCSPFKSEHTEGLNLTDVQRSTKILAQAKEEIQGNNWHTALNLLAAGVTLDPRHAELQYRRGQTLLALDRYKEAENALRLARDEDVCPLRSLTPIPRIVSQVAKEEGTGLVNYGDLLAQRMKATQGHDIPGKEFFLDHVHPTIEGHKILAVALIKEMIEKGIVQPDADWGEMAIATVNAKIIDSVDNEAQGLALANLARVLFWAKKTADAERLATQALEIAEDNNNAALNATSTLATIYMQQHKSERAFSLIYSSLEKVPGAIELHLQLARFLLQPSFQELEKSAANLLLVNRMMPDYDEGHALFGMVMARRGRPRIAYPSLMQALHLNPNNIRAQKILNKIRPLLKGQSPDPQPADIVLDTYPSKAPHQLVQVRHGDSGKRIHDGIEVEFYENGRLKRFLDMSMGQSNRVEMTWDMDGRRL